MAFLVPIVIFALLKSISGFARPGFWRYLVIPPLIGCLVWLLATFFWLGALIDWLSAETLLSWLHVSLDRWHLGWLTTWLAFVGAWVILLGAAYLVTVLVAGAWAMPALVTRLAATDYGDIAPRGRDSVTRSLGVSLRAGIFYLLGWLFTLPVWIVPGMALVHSFFWLAYLNRATFAYEALATHASQAEWQRIHEIHGRQLWILGFVSAMLAYVPLFGFFSPMLAATSFAHFGFAVLRAERQRTAGDFIEGEAQRVQPEA